MQLFCQILILLSMVCTLINDVEISVLGRKAIKPIEYGVQASLILLLLRFFLVYGAGGFSILVKQ